MKHCVSRLVNHPLFHCHVKITRVEKWQSLWFCINIMSGCLKYKVIFSEVISPWRIKLYLYIFSEVISPWRIKLYLYIRIFQKAIYLCTFMLKKRLWKYLRLYLSCSWCVKCSCSLYHFLPEKFSCSGDLILSIGV